MRTGLGRDVRSVGGAVTLVLRYHEARSRALFRELDANPSLLLLGGAVALPFNPDDGLLERYAERILWPPISEFATAAAAIGAAMAGLRTLVPISTSSFMFYGWAPIVNEAPNVRYLSGGAASAPVAFHVMAGSRRGGAAQHEHTPQAMLHNVPGLRVLAPATPADVDAAVHSALTGDDPTVIVDNVRLAEFEGPLGSSPADIRLPTLLRDGSDVLIVSYSLMVQQAVLAAGLLADEGIAAAVLDVAQLAPLPHAELLAATERHDAVLFVDESRAAGSPATHMLARVVQARPRVTARLLCTLDAPAPFAPALVDAIVPGPEQIAAEVRALLGS
jgi:pyruvate/2-oxoglutarate/acetoin dehydrogenase E1 component